MNVNFDFQCIICYLYKKIMFSLSIAVCFVVAFAPKVREFSDPSVDIINKNKK